MDFSGPDHNPVVKAGSNEMSSNSILRHEVDTNAMESTMAGTSLPIQQQQLQQGHQQVQQHHAQSSQGSSDQSGRLYDLSSFDPLQAHALQLTASAGLTNMLTAPAAPATSAPQHNAIATSSTHTQPLHQHSQQQTKAEPQQIQQNPTQRQQQAPPIQQLSRLPPQPQQPSQQSQQQQYYYIQPPSAANSSLQPIAPATQQAIAGQTTQNFILPTTAQGTNIAVPANLPSQLFSNGLAPSAAPGMMPNLYMNQHFQSVTATQQAPQAQQPPLLPVTKKRGNEESSASQQAVTKKKRELAPSVVSSSATSTDGTSISSSMAVGGQFPEGNMDPLVDLSKMSAAERRRYERNLREQQRSYRISQQIKELRDVLSESNVPFKPNKYSILLSVVEYIKQLQGRAIMLDAEHQKLITTIRKTKELVNSGTNPSSADETEATNTTGNTSASDSASDSEMLFVQGLDYRSLFEQCPAALGIAALDGRILECNSEFQLLLGFPQEELLRQSLFNLVRNHQDIFRAMAEMLKFAEDPHNANGASSTSMAPKNCYWSGPVVSKRDVKVRICENKARRNLNFVQQFSNFPFFHFSQLSMNLTLTVGDDGSPKFFSCALTNS